MTPETSKAGHPGGDAGLQDVEQLGSELGDSNTAASAATQQRPSHQQTTCNPADIIVGERHRKDVGDLADLVRSINERGGLIHPIALTPRKEMIAGGRRLQAWTHPDCKFRAKPIPVSIIDIDSIVAGEFDENQHRKDFTPSELVAIKRSIEPQLKAAARDRQAAAGGSKRLGQISRSAGNGGEGGRAADHVAKAVGKSRRTIDKAAAIVAAAEAEPEKYAKLKAAMDRTGKVNGPYRRLKVMQQTDALRSAPPTMPAGPHSSVVIDFPWSAEDKDQRDIDAAGRSFRGYPEMSPQACCDFVRDKLRPMLAPDCCLWMWVTNFHLVNGTVHKVIAALGDEFKAVTILTWDKVNLGRGHVLRDVTEHCVLLTRGKPVINIFGEDPPSTLIRSPRRDNSQKPDDFYRLVERVNPASRHLSVFSTGGEGERWDCYGDQVSNHAAPTRQPAEPVLTVAECVDLFITNVLLHAEEGPVIKILASKIVPTFGRRKLNECKADTVAFSAPMIRHHRGWRSLKTRDACISAWLRFWRWAEDNGHVKPEKQRKAERRARLRSSK